MEFKKKKTEYSNTFIFRLQMPKLVIMPIYFWPFGNRKVWNIKEILADFCGDNLFSQMDKPHAV